MRVTIWLFLACLLASLGASLPARACTVCANPSFDVRDGTTYQPRRFRLDLRVQVGGARAGTTQATDTRMELVYTYAPLSKLELSLAVPALYRTLRTGSATKNDATPGDLELAATGTLWRATDHGFAEALTLVGGFKLPTAPPERDAYGTLLSSTLQPGCNAVTPNLSIAYAFSSGRWGFSAGGGIYFPIPVRDAPHTGESIRSSAMFELRPLRQLAARGGLAMRLEPSGELRPDVGDPNSGGFIGSLVTELVVTPHPAFDVGAAMYAPVIQALHGSQRVLSTYGARITLRL